jgi:hypothetical protein
LNEDFEEYGLSHTGYMVLDIAMRLVERGVPVEIVEYALDVSREGLIQLLSLSLKDREQLSNDLQEFLGEV